MLEAGYPYAFIARMGRMCTCELTSGSLRMRSWSAACSKSLSIRGTLDSFRLHHLCSKFRVHSLFLMRNDPAFTPLWSCAMIKSTELDRRFASASAACTNDSSFTPKLKMSVSKSTTHTQVLEPRPKRTSWTPGSFDHTNSRLASSLWKNMRRE